MLVMNDETWDIVTLADGTIVEAYTGMVIVPASIVVKSNTCEKVDEK